MDPSVVANCQTFVTLQPCYAREALPPVALPSQNCRKKLVGPAKRGCGSLASYPIAERASCYNPVPYGPMPHPHAYPLSLPVVRRSASADPFGPLVSSRRYFSTIDIQIGTSHATEEGMRKRRWWPPSPRSASVGGRRFCLLSSPREKDFAVCFPISFTP
ncbi:hypothetical protein B296_00044496 [Ensete ventricosum]|uniref:Uncharacterized protein n=1 Tax=Ensete ventricosum TaxID=4639 RepID=A0A426ZAQ8_ENSVE|nr:hypothetical protein B296_00044496 [Ensete ventricosum]